VARERETEAVRSHRQRSVEGGRRTVGAVRLPFAHRLGGLAINAIWHVKWADPIAALAVLPVIFWEGRGAMRGKTCGCCWFRRVHPICDNLPVDGGMTL
jgi:hypothetical protein